MRPSVPVRMPLAPNRRATGVSVRASQSPSDPFAPPTASSRPSDETIRQLEARLSNGLRSMAKLLACALLQAERSELAIGERLTNADIAVRRTCFNFTAKHLIPMFVTVAGMTFLGCYLSLLAFALAQDNTAELLQRYGFMYLTLPYITWPLATVIVWVANLVLDQTPGPWQLSGRRGRFNRRLDRP